MGHHRQLDLSFLLCFDVFRVYLSNLDNSSWILTGLLLERERGNNKEEEVKVKISYILYLE